jgi:pSer/pThr/pTyr-binding forkhead associated (FHA) protein
MKLVFPGGEHPQVLLGPGVSRIGSGPDANIVLDTPGVMPRHCELHVTAHGVTMRVPEGAHVRVNHREVGGVIALRLGDLVAFEGVQARLASHEPANPESGEALSAAAPANDDLAATVVRPALPRYVLRGISGAGFGRTFPLLGPTLLGRATDCGILLNHPGLSRHHARLTPTEEGLLVEDLGSTNGCLLNDVQVGRAWARHGDELGIDTLRFRVVVPGSEPVHVEARKAARASPAGRPRRRTWWWLAVVAAILAATWLLVVPLS